MTKKETFKQIMIDDGRLTVPLVNRKCLGLKKGTVVKVTIEVEA